MICVAEFYDLCPRLSAWGSCGESRKVGVMKFGLMLTDNDVEFITKRCVSLRFVQTKVNIIIIVNTFLE